MPRWRCCFDRIWLARDLPRKRLFEFGLAAYVADDAAEPRAQDAQLPAMAVELLRVGESCSSKLFNHSSG
jgi:hypothetical protein